MSDDAVDLTILPRKGGGVALSLNRELAELLLAAARTCRDSPVAFVGVSQHFAHTPATIAQRLDRLVEVLERALATPPKVQP